LIIKIKKRKASNELKLSPNKIQRVTCSSCGLPGHSMKTHSFCPNNKKYQTNTPKTTIEKTKICKCGIPGHANSKSLSCQFNHINLGFNFTENLNEIDINKKPCICGEFTHKRRSSLLCKMNKRYLQQIKTLDDYNDIINNEVTINEKTKVVKKKNKIKSAKIKKTNNETTKYRIARQPIFELKMVNGINIDTDPQSINYCRHVLPKRHIKCPYCESLMWIEEKTSKSSKKNPKFGLCCLSGQIKLAKEIKLPDSLYQLLIGTNKESKLFRTYIRLYNSILSFSSMSANVNENMLQAKTGTYTYKINGTVHHKLSHLLPNGERPPQFSQIYIYDSEMQTQIRSGMFSGTIDSTILNKVQELLDQFNPYVRIYKQAGEILRKEPSKSLNIVLKSNTTKDKTLNLPTSSEIAVLMINSEDSDTISKRDVIVNKRNDTDKYPLMFLNENISYYDPLGYSLMHINGEQGWQYSTYPKLNKDDIKNRDILIKQHQLNSNTKNFNNINQEDIDNLPNEYSQNSNLHNLTLEIETDTDTNLMDNDIIENTENKTKFITAREFYAYRLQDRTGTNLFFKNLIDIYNNLE